jgi:hypothetical protein
VRQLFFLFFLTSSVLTRAQSEYFLLKGKALSKENFEPIESCIIKAKRYLTFSKEGGNFEILVKDADTLNLSIMGYKNVNYVVSKLNMSPTILMIRDTFSLKTINIKAHAAEFELRNMLLKEIPDTDIHLNKNAGIRSKFPISKIPPPASVMQPASFIYENVFAPIQKRKKKKPGPMPKGMSVPVAK